MKNILYFDISYQGLSSPRVSAHIHGLAPRNITAPIIFDLKPFFDTINGTSGRAVGKWRYPEALQVGILSNLTYVNIHSQLNPAGEIRGQIEFV